MLKGKNVILMFCLLLLFKSSVVPDCQYLKSHCILLLGNILCRTGMVGVPGTASAIFNAVKDVGANVIMISQVSSSLSNIYLIFIYNYHIKSNLIGAMQASSEHSVCFAVPEKEVKAVAEVLESRFKQALGVGRISQVLLLPKIPLSVFVLLYFSFVVLRILVCLL